MGWWHSCCCFFCCCCRGVSSFNSLIHDYESDCESEYESEYESGLDDESLPPSSPCSTTSHISRANSYSRHRRHGSFVKRMVRKLFWPLRIWWTAFFPSFYVPQCKKSQECRLQKIWEKPVSTRTWKTAHKKGAWSILCFCHFVYPHLQDMMLPPNKEIVSMETKPVQEKPFESDVELRNQDMWILGY